MVIGRFNNPAQYQNQADHSQVLTEGQLNRVREIRPKVTRAWISPQWYYDHATGTYTFDYLAPNGESLYGYLDQIISTSERLFLNINQCDQEIMDENAPERCAEAIYQGLLHYKQRYPTFEFVELFNEPDRDWAERSGTPRAMNAAIYYRWYKIGYKAVHRVNSALAPEIPIKIGGPVTYYFDRAFIGAFLDRFAADEDGRKRLDFISYHQYKARANPSSVTSEKSGIQRMLADRHLDTATPIFVTEVGVFPGDTTGTTLEADQLTQAAALCILTGNYAISGMDMAMHWAFDHPTNDRKDMFVEGTEDAVTPYFNVIRMQRMLKQSLLASESSALTKDGLGMNVLATRDDSGLATILTNYQWTDEDGPSHVVAVDFERLPRGLRDRKLHVSIYLIDSSHSNFGGGSARGDLEKAVDQQITATDSLQLSITLERNAIALVTVTG
jgi:hypothetical protein